MPQQPARNRVFGSTATWKFSASKPVDPKDPNGNLKLVSVDPKQFMKDNKANWNSGHYDTVRPLLGSGVKPVKGKMYNTIGSVQVDSNGHAKWGTNSTAKDDKTKYEWHSGWVRYKDNSGKIIYAHGYYTEKKVVKDVSTYIPAPTPERDPNKYKWNLPPHLWSRPYMSAYSPMMPKGYKKAGSGDRYRRGRIWWHSNDPNSQVFRGNSKGKTSRMLNGEDREFGFQFLWNPESFGTAVSVQMEATPDTHDRFLAVAGVFPGTESISFTVRLDRTNDFAAAGNLGRPSDIEHSKGATSTAFITQKDVADLVKYYRVPGSFSHARSKSDVEWQLVDLFQRGTVADLDYLYKAINGTGPGSSTKSGHHINWVNSRGQKTADIGFLMPTLLNVDIGPLSYQGYVTSLNVTHIGFTPDMTPIRTDVTISMNLLATAGITTGTAQSSN